MSVIQLENHSSVSPLISEMGNEKHNTIESDYMNAIHYNNPFRTSIDSILPPSSLVH